MQSSTIRPVTPEDIPALLDIFRAAYAASDHVDDDEAIFVRELHASFEAAQLYRIHFFALLEGQQILAFGGIAESCFMDGSWELRWGTTHPAHQRRGLMSQLAAYRLDYARTRTTDLPGIVHIGARHPGLYIKMGFQPLFRQPRQERGDIHYLTKLSAKTRR